MWCGRESTVSAKLERGGPRPGMWADAKDDHLVAYPRGNDAYIALEVETLTLSSSRFENFSLALVTGHAGATATKPLSYRRPEATSFPLSL